ncbi:putative pua RNA binding domain-containing protein [Rosellinia necatrix]|uniref:Putative pua RNA binding domain-containing protein n=1 Tax=Rosellinia necatrix TaxID=77044 RepID=A0A1S8A7U2_ROSNE|nr:putative pua RNA binding domain-containing protein [Rosellinia necatrix]
MPLNFLGTSSNSGDPTQDWTNKLVGKTVSDSSHSETNFCKKDLPQQCRVIHPGMLVTKDFRPERLNVHVREDGIVSHVQHG